MRASSLRFEFEENDKLNERRRREGAGETKRTLKKMLKSCQPFYVTLTSYWSLYRPGNTLKKPVTKFMFCLKKDRLKRSKNVWLSFLISLTRVRTGRKVITHLSVHLFIH